MKAMVYQEFGLPEVLELLDVETPTPAEDEVLVHVHASSVNWLDWHFMTGKPLLTRLMAGLRKPKNRILGVDFSGRVEAVGSSVRTFKAGDEVWGSTKSGCFAELVCVHRDELQEKPNSISFKEAAAIGAAASTALHGLRDAGKIKAGQNVAINGASGGVGSFAVQIGKAFKSEVTGICSTSNLDLLRSIGADHVIDYTQEDFTQDGRTFDLIFDVVAKLSFSDCRRVLVPNGTVVTSEFSPMLALKGAWMSLISGHNLVPLQPAPPNREDLAFLRGLLEEGKIRPIIDSEYSLEDLPTALLHLESGHARGKIIVVVGEE